MVSIIVPNYNHEQYLRKRLDSIFNQSYQDFEVILLDDASTDNSVEILTEYASNPKVSHFEINEQNSGGPFGQWKKGIELAIGDYIWIAESDDWAELNFLEKVYQFISHNKLSLVFTNSRIVDENDKPNGKETNGWSHAHVNGNILYGTSTADGTLFTEKYMMIKNTIPNASSVIFRRDNVDMNLVAFNMKMAGDWLFWISICCNHQIGYIDEALNNFRKHSGNVTVANSKLLREECLLVLRYARRYLGRSLSGYSSIIKSHVLWMVKEFGWHVHYSFSKKRLKELFVLLCR